MSKLHYLILILLCLLVSLICNDIEDILVHDYENSIFYCGDDSFWEPSNREEADYAWWVPKWYYDGWHASKVVRQWMVYINVPWLVLLLSGVVRFSTGKQHFKSYFLFSLTAWTVVYVMHQTFYNGMFVK